MFAECLDTQLVQQRYLVFADIKEITNLFSITAAPAITITTSSTTTSCSSISFMLVILLVSINTVDIF